MYTDIGTVVFPHIVLNEDEWTVGFVLHTNDPTSTDTYQQRLIKQLTGGRREWIQQQGQTCSLKKNTPLVLSYKDDLLVAQQNIKSLQERLLELESQQQGR